jgi:hypothetical protein
MEPEGDSDFPHMLGWNAIFQCSPGMSYGTESLVLPAIRWPLVDSCLSARLEISASKSMTELVPSSGRRKLQSHGWFTHSEECYSSGSAINLHCQEMLSRAKYLNSLEEYRFTSVNI